MLFIRKKNEYIHYALCDNYAMSCISTTLMSTEKAEFSFFSIYQTITTTATTTVDFLQFLIVSKILPSLEYPSYNLWR